VAGIDQNTLWQLASMILGKPKEVTTTRERATFLRTDQDGTQWVRLPSSNDETPVNGRTLATAKAGDTVEWSIHDGRLSITGNESQPSVGMREVFQTASDIVQPVVERISKVNELAALSKNVADAAQRVADAVNQHFFSDTNGVHVTEATQDEWDESHEGANVLINALGQLFRDGLNNLLTLTTENGARALTVWDGLGNAAANVRAVIGETITLGNAASGSVVTIDSDSMDMVHGTTEMLHFGYGLGTSMSGTANAPYYTVGTRAANSTVGNYSVAEGYLTTASGFSSHAEGVQTTASANISHAEGANAIASGLYSHAEGNSATASGDASHAEGVNTTASGYSSHAEGVTTTASRYAAHAEGHVTTASGYYSHAEGYGSTASGDYSHAQNRGTVAAHDNQTAIGRYNDNDSDSSHAFEIGNGTDDDHRSNAFAVDWAGNVECAGTISPTATESTVTVNTSNVSASGVNKCWSNGAAVSFAYTFSVKSALASGSPLAVGTLPSGYRPPYNFAAEVYTSNASNVLASVSTDGVITIRNVGSGSLATTTTIRVNGTFVP
jgi:hypothetical protein